MISSRALRSLPLSVMLSGDLNWFSGFLGSRGTRGYFWASTVSADVNASFMDFDSAKVRPQNGAYKPYGFPLRCVASFLPELSAAFLFRL